MAEKTLKRGENALMGALSVGAGTAYFGASTVGAASWQERSVLLLISLAGAAVTIRCLRMRLVIGSDVVTIHNVLRTYRLATRSVQRVTVVQSPWIASVLIVDDGRQLRISAIAPSNPLFRSNKEASALVDEANRLLVEAKSEASE